MVGPLGSIGQTYVCVEPFPDAIIGVAPGGAASGQPLAKGMLTTGIQVRKEPSNSIVSSYLQSGTANGAT
jgi:hypothetical protein